jgi:hypothetical protein
MSNQKPRNPDVDFGFHAQIPRLVRTGYRDLTPVQKWLYACLKDLCGDHGTCYRTVKVLAEETGISTGMISESIPVLHSHGLIHGEKKKRHTGGKEVWHITIVDIWPANAKAHPTKRSLGEQTVAANIHSANVNVHSVNDLPLKRSAGEYTRSLCETEGLPGSNKSNEGLPVEERAGDFQSPHALGFTEDDYHFYGTQQQHLIWNCHNWCAGNHGTCADYVAAIANGWREAETGKQPAVQIGATDATSTHPGLPATSDASRAGGVPGAVMGSGPGKRATAQEVRAPETDRLAIASTPGSAVSPPTAAARQSQTPFSRGPQDGAAAEEDSEPRASGRVRLSERERSLKAWLEELRGIELDLSRRDVTAIRSLSAKKGSDDKEMFLNIVAVLDSDPWFEEHSVAVDFYWIDYHWNNKYLFLQRKKPKAALDDGERRSDFDAYVGNGPEERKRWREKSAEMKAQGFSPDL